jgi:hypothetical protein
MGLFNGMNPDDAELMKQGVRVPQPRFGDNLPNGKITDIGKIYPGPIPPEALSGVVGAGMAGVAGAGLGLLGNWALRQYGSTLVLKQQADSAQQIARALEAAQMNSSRDRSPSFNGTNTGR